MKKQIIFLTMFVIIFLIITNAIAGMKFEILYPTKKLPVQDSSPLFSWTPYEGATNYQLTIATDKDTKKKPESVVIEEKFLTDTVYRPKVQLRYKVKYYLTLLVYSGSKKKKEISNYEFMLDYSPPVDIISPQNGAAIKSINPIFSWKSYNGISGYDIELGSDSVKFEKSILFSKTDVGNISINSGPDGKLNTNDDYLVSKYDFPVNLDTNKTYYWRAMSIYKQNDKVIGKSKWSLVYSFSIPESNVSENITGLYQVTNEEKQDEYEPALATNGSMIAYTVKNDDGSSEVWVKKAIVSTDKNAPKKFEETGIKITSKVGRSHDEEPQWTLDSKNIIFTSDREGGIKNIWMRNIDSIGNIQLTTSTFGSFNAKVSPDGKRIIYVALTEDKEPYIWVMNMDGTKKTQLVKGINPSWAHKSNAIVYNDEQSGQQEIYYLNLANGAKEQLTNSQGEYSSLKPTWAPDDTKIAFTSNKNGNWDVWVMGTTGAKAEKQITNLYVADKDPFWGNSGKIIYFSSFRAGKGSLDIWRGNIQ